MEEDANGAGGDAAVCESGPDRYTILDSFIGEGTFGKVMKARDKLTGKEVAIKRVLVATPADDAEYTVMHGINVTVYKEIKIMKELHHENLMRLEDVYVEGDFICLVMPLMFGDLKALMSNRSRIFTEPVMKCILLQIMRGVNELHRNWFLHRDLSPANVFIAADGMCKVADYGLSRTFGSPRNSAKTDVVVTLWYRAPELLFGARYYQDKVDIWSLGCILGEMLLGGRPLFPGTSELNQLQRIFSVLGTPAAGPDEDGTSMEDSASKQAAPPAATTATTAATAANTGPWAHAHQLPKFVQFSKKDPTPWKTIFPHSSAAAIDLLAKLLKLDPLERINVDTALKHPWFHTPPRPLLPSQLPLT